MYEEEEIGISWEEQRAGRSEQQLAVRVSDRMEEQGRSLMKKLAHSNKTTREKALRVVLKSWLPSQSEALSDEDAKKLWKGLFYCMWHSDKPLVQADLVDRLSSLLLSLHLPLSLQYFSTFLLTMRREWSGIDSLRLDKFYLLIRSFLSKFFSLMQINSWDPPLVHRLLHLFDLATFSAPDIFSHTNAVNYHISSVFLQELLPFLPLNLHLLHLLFKPFISALGNLPDKVLVAKIRSGVFDVLLHMGKRLLEVKKTGHEVDSRDDLLLLGTVSLVMGFSGRFYEMGSSAECCQGNRKVLFALHSEFLKVEKDAANSGFHFSIPDDDPLPELVPLGPAQVAANGEVFNHCQKDKGVSVDAGKTKKKKNKNKGHTSDLANATESYRTNVTSDNGKENVASEHVGNLNDSAVVLSENVISNLQKQFEKIAEEAGLDDEIVSACDSPEAASTTGGAVSKKRKRTKSSKGKASQSSADLDGGDAEERAVAKSGEMSTKKVRFSMKNNLVWKPHNPLPPQSLRLPPSATPRGSALKKGVPPGPIREMPPPTKKPKLKKARKAIKGVSPSVKRLKKLKSRAAA
ncbi:hypothetical protein VNO78_22990 [Psophocarpus tetragonolobus]|uniref:Uncharacterized protein n=1 Tax=Psophocarpus tetragonolobus TaxID=3891 RepID=A0AAN9S421_PSOTE